MATTMLFDGRDVYFPTWESLYLWGLCQVLNSEAHSPHFSRGCTEVHLLFDNPGQLKDTPQFFEHKRRDESATIATGHTCDDINELTRLPTKWRENVLHCRKCKRTLVCFLAEFMLKHMHSHLSPHQKFYIAGVFAEHLQTCLGLWKEAAVHNQIQCIPAMQKKQTPCCGYMLRRHTLQ